MRFIIMLSIIIILLVSITTAQVPQVLNYQGQLNDDTGEPVANGTYPIVFTIYDAVDASSGLWYSGIQNIMVVNGLFNYQLGSTNPLPSTIFTDSSRWLGIRVDGEDIVPRTQLITVPYAYHALRADTAEYAVSGSGGGWIDNGASVSLETSSDYVGIGTSSPTHRLHIVGSESNPLLNVEKLGSGRGVRVYTTSACALWVENSGNHGLRVTNANGDGVHVTQAGGWAGYFNGDAYISGDVGIGSLFPETELDVDGTTKTLAFKMPTGSSDGYVLTSDGDGNGTWQASASRSGESGTFEGIVSSDYVEIDPSGKTIIKFERPFKTKEVPHTYITVVLKQASNGLFEGATIMAITDIKGTPGNWTGFEIKVSKYNGSSIMDAIEVYVTWMAITKH